MPDRIHPGFRQKIQVRPSPGAPPSGWTVSLVSPSDLHIPFPPHLFSPSRTYFYSGCSTNPPSPVIPPGVTEQSHFTNSGLRFWGCTGILVYEADTFTLAILFCNPLMYNFFHMKLALETSLCKGHCGNLRNDYTRMYSGQPLTTDDSRKFSQTQLSEYQQPVVVSAGDVRVTATMSDAAQSIIKVIVENRDSSSSKPNEDTRV